MTYTAPQSSPAPSRLPVWAVLTALLVASQEARDVKLEGRTQAVLPLPIEKAEISPARSKQDEASLEVVFLLVTLHERSEENSGS